MISQLLHKENMKERFVHDTLSDYFLAEYFAKKINSRELSVKDAYFNSWSYPEERDLWCIKDMKKEGNYALLSAWKPVIYFMLDILNDPDDFVLKLNKYDPHIAARCIGKYTEINDNVVKSVVNKLGRRLDEVLSYEAYLAVESLGETKSDIALPLLTKVFKGKRGNFYFDHETDMIALAKINSEEALETLYEYIVDPRFITGRTPPYKKVAFWAMEEYSDPELLSRFLFDKLMNNGQLYMYWMYCKNKFYQLSYEESLSLCMSFSSGSDTESIKKTYAESILNGKPQIKSFNPDEDPRFEWFLPLIGKGASQDIIDKIREYLFDESNAKKNNWYLDTVREIVPFLNKSNLEQLIFKEKKDIRTVNLRGSESDLYKVYSEKKDGNDIAYVYLNVSELQKPARFVAKACTELYSSKFINVCDSTQFAKIESVLNTLIWLSSYLSSGQTIVRLELSSEDPEKRLFSFMKEIIDQDDFKTTISKISQLESINKQIEQRISEEKKHEIKLEESSKKEKKVYCPGRIYNSGGIYSEFVRKGVRDVDSALTSIKNASKLDISFGGMIILSSVGTINDLPKIKDALNQETFKPKRMCLANAIAMIQEKTRPKGYKVD